ncbi:MAG: polysulfide reductase NrfD [Nitrospinota bacterium]|nr:polysulfide reductase NrfD [Nitrospinota bacterium]
MFHKIRNFLVALMNIFHGSPLYYAWIFFLLAVMGIGLYAYSVQWNQGFIVTSIRDEVSWGFYIANFTFLVGVAAAAVLLVVPAYIYHFGPIKEIVFLGEIMAITAICMCIMFVTADLGRPERILHMAPLIGTPNFPSSLLVWDVVVLNGYLFINAIIFLYVLYKIYEGKSYAPIMPLIILSIPWAVSIHTVTAFLYNGLPARPFWNAGILAPRFLASAFCSGPAIIILVFQIVGKFTRINIDIMAIRKVAELIAYTMALNIFLLGCEVFKEFYSNSVHLAPLKYMYFGLHGHQGLVPLMWTSLALNLTALVIFVVPATRRNIALLNIGCVLIIVGVYIEKGFGLVIPGFTPSTLGEIYEYWPSGIELGVSVGIWATGALIYTLLLKFTLPVYSGETHIEEPEENRERVVTA